MNSKKSKITCIILAAGMGTRLYPITKDCPKCLVNLFGKSLIEYQIEIFRKFGVDQIIVVSGHLGELISLENIHIIKNSNYVSTNMLETLFCAKSYMTDIVIVSYGDIIFEEQVFDKLYNSTDEISVIVDKNWEQFWSLRFENPLDDAESLKIDKDGFIQEIGKKTTKIEDIQAQYIGLMKFSGHSLKKIKKIYEESKSTSKNNVNPINPDIPFEKLYLTDFLQELIRQKLKIKSIPISGGWLELDSLNDYNLYNELFKKNQLKPYFQNN